MAFSFTSGVRRVFSPIRMGFASLSPVGIRWGMHSSAAQCCGTHVKVLLQFTSVLEYRASSIRQYDTVSQRTPATTHHSFARMKPAMIDGCGTRKRDFRIYKTPPKCLSPSLLRPRASTKPNDRSHHPQEFSNSRDPAWELSLTPFFSTFSGDQRLQQPQKTKKKQSMATRTSDSKTVMKVQTTLSTKSKSGHRIADGAQLGDSTEKSNSGHRNIEDGKDQSEKPNSGHRKMEEDQFRPIPSLAHGPLFLPTSSSYKYRRARCFATRETGSWYADTKKISPTEVQLL
ncbi:hypothetical protein ACLOJK_026598 [Asimina triloba]